MYGDQPRTIREDPLQVFVAIDEQAAGARSHEDLDTARRTGVIDLIEIAGGRADEETVIDHRAARGACELIIQRRLADGRRIGVRHFEETGDAALGRGARARGYVLFIFLSGFAEMDLWIDDSRKE